MHASDQSAKPIEALDVQYRSVTTSQTCSNETQHLMHAYPKFVRKIIMHYQPQPNSDVNTMVNAHTLTTFSVHVSS